MSSLRGLRRMPGHRPRAPATDEKRRGAAFPGGCARGVFPRRV